MNVLDVICGPLAFIAVYCSLRWLLENTTE